MREHACCSRCVLFYQKNCGMQVCEWEAENFIKCVVLMCASSLMEFYAIEDYQMSTCLWMSLMSDNEAIYFIKFFKTCSCFSMFFNSWLSFFKLKSQPTLHGKLNSFMVIENDSIVQCTFLNTLWIWLFMCHNMTLSTHCKTYHQNWKALMFIWEPKPLRWNC